MVTFEVGHRYSQDDVREIVGVGRERRGGKWVSGCVPHNGEFFIFANVGGPATTGHDHGNRWEDNRLHWSHVERSKLSSPSVQRLLETGRVVHVFWRSENPGDFEYAGRATPIEYQDTTPVRVIWGFSGELPPVSLQSGPDLHLHELAEKLFWQTDDASKVLYEIDRGLKDKGQVIFQGPPGTGKTYAAKAVAEWLTRGGGGYEVVQFHPSYTYEDFVEGFRPTLSEETGQAGYRLKPGPLRLMAEKAEENRHETFILVIDEINRGNLGKVLGELYFLLEYRDEEVSLQYSDKEFQLPENLWFIGTMNTTDRSIALVDAALRRRFYFYGFYPDEEPISGLLKRWLEQNNPDASWVDDLLKKANSELADHHLQIGPSYFMKNGLALDEANVKFIWEKAVMPYIEEQFFGDTDTLRKFQYDTLITAIRNPSASISPMDNQTEDGEDVGVDLSNDGDGNAALRID